MNTGDPLVIHWLKRRVKHKRFWMTSLWHELSGRRVVHFLHIGKTGGTAIKHALRPYLEGGEFVIVLHNHRFSLEDVPARDGAFFVLRDPISRFVSGFCSRKRKGMPRYYVPWSPVERDSFEKFGSPNELAEALSSSDEGVRSLANRGMDGILHVSSHLSDWLVSPEYVRSRINDIVHIGFQESLKDDFRDLKSTLGIDAPITLPDDKVLSHRNPRDCDRDLSELAEENLKSWYREDYEILAVCKQLARGQV